MGPTPANLLFLVFVSLFLVPGARADKTLTGSSTVYTRDALKNNNTKLYLQVFYKIFLEKKYIFI